MSDDNSKAWKKTEDIPRRFDELPPEPEWVPVADVIRTQREEEARQEAEKIKIMPPPDSNSESENETPHEEAVKKEKPPKELKNKNVRKNETPKKFIDESVPPTVDDVTRSMVDWALKTDPYPKKAHKHPSHHRDLGKPLVGQQRSSNFALDTGHNGKERHINRRSNMSSVGELKKHSTPHDNYFSQPDMLSSQKMQRYPAGAARTRPQQSTTSHNERRPLYDEPSPDYDDDDYNAYYSRYQDQYYYDQDMRRDEHYPHGQGYEDEFVAGPYLDGAGLYYDENPPYNQQVYTDSPGDFEYEYGVPQDPYEHQRGYPEVLPPYDQMPHDIPRAYDQMPHDIPRAYDQMPHDIPRGKPNSKYDVLY